MTLKKDNIAVLMVHLFIMSVVAVTDYLTGIYRYEANKINDIDMGILERYTKGHIVDLLSSVYSKKLKTDDDVYDLVFTNKFEDKHVDVLHGHDIDGNQVDKKCRLIESKNIRSIIDKGIFTAKTSSRYTVCGSYEKRKGLYFKMALIIASDLTVAINTVVLKDRIPNSTFCYPNVLQTVSIVLFVAIVLLSLAILWQLWHLKVCVTTQFIVENISKLGIKSIAMKNDKPACWHALSVYLQDITLGCSEHRNIYNRQRVGMNKLKVQCGALKNDMESTMHSISDSSYKLAGSNFTGTLVFFMMVSCASSNKEGRTLADALIIASVGLFVTSAWYTLIVAGELMRYSSFLDKLKILTINMNFLSMCAKEATQENMLMKLVRQLRGRRANHYARDTGIGSATLLRRDFWLDIEGGAPESSLELRDN